MPVAFQSLCVHTLAFCANDRWLVQWQALLLQLALVTFWRRRRTLLDLTMHCATQMITPRIRTELWPVYDHHLN